MLSSMAQTSTTFPKTQIKTFFDPNRSSPNPKQLNKIEIYKTEIAIRDRIANF